MSSVPAGAAGAAGAGGAAAAAIANAIKASGTIVQVSEDAFFEILARVEEPLVVHSPSGFLAPHRYIFSYKGLCFFTKSKEPLYIKSKIDLIEAEKIWIP
ncbi:MAG: hypothetical protein GY869_22540 [Planctomycetes bacterium]|nr:hypothetical protein [Planctomycetota bacterium]